MCLLSYSVVNIYETKSDEVLYELELQAPYSQRIYLGDSTVTKAEHLEFLTQLVRSEQVSIIKSDFSGATYTKSILLNEETFPYDALYLPHDLTEKLKVENVLSNQNAQSGLPYFAKRIVLHVQTLDTYYQDLTASVEGVYTIVSEQPFDRDRIITQFSQQYQLSDDELTQIRQVRVAEIINLKLMGTIISFILILLMVVLMRFVLPLANLKETGVKKLLGFTKWELLKEEVSGQIFVVVAVILVVNSYIYWTKNFFPNGFWRTLLIMQYILVLGLLFQSYLITVFKNRILISNIIKSFYPQMKLFICFVAVIKVLSLLSLFFMTFHLSILHNETQEFQDVGQFWADKDDLLFVKTFHLSAEAQNEDMMGKDPLLEVMGDLYFQAEEQLGAYFVRPEDVSRRYAGYEDLSQDYDYLVVNWNYFQDYVMGESIEAQVDQIREHLFLIPEKLVPNQDQVIQDLQLIAYQKMKEDVRPSSPEDIQITVVAYQSKKEIITYEGNLLSLEDPVIHVVTRDTIYYSDLRYVATTSIQSALKFPLIETINEDVNRILGDNIHRVRLNFTSIRQFYGEIIDGYQNYIRIERGIILVTHLINTLISFMILFALMLLNWQKLFVKKFLGFKVVDKYRLPIVVLAICYIMGIIITTYFSRSVLPVYLGMSYFIIEVLLNYLFIRFYEQRDLVGMIKGGV